MATSADAIANASTGTVSVSASVTVIENVPDNKVGLRFLLISGKKTDLLVDPNATLDFVKKAIYEAWPQGTIPFFNIELKRRETERKARLLRDRKMGC